MRSHSTHVFDDLGVKQNSINANSTVPDATCQANGDQQVPNARVYIDYHIEYDKRYYLVPACWLTLKLSRRNSGFPT